MDTMASQMLKVSWLKVTSIFLFAVCVCVCIFTGI